MNLESGLNSQTGILYYLLTGKQEYHGYNKNISTNRYHYLLLFIITIINIYYR